MVVIFKMKKVYNSVGKLKAMNQKVVQIPTLIGNPKNKSKIQQDNYRDLNKNLR